MIQGLVHQRHCCASTSHMTVARLTAARPPVKSTYDPVHKLLLIGNDQCHIRPNIIASAPPADSPARRSYSVLGCAIQRPARFPSSAVHTAPDVERMPSGSHVWLLTQRWFPNPKRDQSSRRRSM